jgi:hypothetical protein
MRTQALNLSLVLACCSLVAAFAQPPGGQKEQKIVDTATAKLSAAIGAQTAASGTVSLRLSTEIDLAQMRCQLQETAAQMELASRLAAAIAAVPADPVANGPQARAALSQEFGSATQTFIQAMAQANQELVQKVAESYQRFSQQRSADTQLLSQNASAAAQAFAQAMSAADLGAGAPVLDPSPVELGAPLAVAADKSPQAVCRTEIQEARRKCDASLADAKNASLAEIRQALAPASRNADTVKAAVGKATRRFQLVASDALDAYDIAAKAALRKYALAALD